ncbi:hypothetical protein JKA73_02575 [Myxococcus xanthus]|nr:hypothetical protein [Myxococcus xanthus]QQR45046.1 hypothetical protein JKA73_02575 [Myxococcus xanthus]
MPEKARQPVSPACLLAVDLVVISYRGQGADTMVSRLAVGAGMGDAL